MLMILCDDGFIHEHVIGLYYETMMMFTLNDIVGEVGIAYGSYWVYLVE